MEKNICIKYDASVIQQMYKLITNKETEELEQKDVFPITLLQAVFDGSTGTRLDHILSLGNCIYVPFQGTKESTRLKIGSQMRRRGLIIVFKDLDDVVHTQQYIYKDSISDENWKDDANWVECFVNKDDDAYYISLKEEIMSEVNTIVKSLQDKIDNVNVSYSPADTSQTVPTTIGSIEKGTKASELAGKSLSEMWDLLLYPTIYPTFVAPTATLVPTGTYTLEVGSTFPKNKSDFSVSFNKGAINLNGSKQNNRAGDLINYEINCSEDTWPTAVSYKTVTITGTINYKEGPQPKDSKGKDYSSPLPAGSVKTSNSYIVKGGYVIIAGYSTKTEISAEDISTLRTNGNASSVVTNSSMPSISLSVTHNSAAYTWLCIPSTITNFNVSNLKDGNGFGYSMSETIVKVTYNGITYNCYRSNAAQEAGTQIFVY